MATWFPTDTRCGRLISAKSLMTAERSPGRFGRLCAISIGIYISKTDNRSGAYRLRGQAFTKKRDKTR
jgi:hypothetical protein